MEEDLTSTQQRLSMHAVVMCTFAGRVEAFPPHTVYLELPHVLPSPVIRAAERMNRTLKQHQPNIAKKQTSLGRKSATCLFSGHCMPSNMAALLLRSCVATCLYHFPKDPKGLTECETPTYIGSSKMWLTLHKAVHSLSS